MWVSDIMAKYKWIKDVCDTALTSSMQWEPYIEKNTSLDSDGARTNENLVNNEWILNGRDCFVDNYHFMTRKENVRNEKLIEHVDHFIRPQQQVSPSSLIHIIESVTEILAVLGKCYFILYCHSRCIMVFRNLFSIHGKFKELIQQLHQAN